MQFNLLGPLEIVRQDRPVALGGVTQRATLAFLLLHANEAVATSRLLKALWGEDSPATARKMLQNAVSGLRRTLAVPVGEIATVSLETQTPGYVLSVSTDDIDWFRFQTMVERGRDELAAGALRAGTLTLRAALGLWRGPVLSDLAEAGISWPELAIVHRTRPDALEDCAEAELAIGRHHEMVAELEAEAVLQPARERLCGQLMVALYRCDRQSDALAAFRRTRAALAEQFGLDPGRQLRDLELAILTHDRSLMLPVADAPVEIRAEAPVPAVATQIVAERKPVSLLLVRAQLSPQVGGHDPEQVDEILKEFTATVREEAERFGGVLHGGVATVWTVLFGVPRTQEDDASRAVRTAIAIRDRFGATLPSEDGRPGTPQLTARAALTTGEALVTYRQVGEDVSMVDATGGVLDEGLQLLALAVAGEVRVCDTTRQVGGCEFSYAERPEPYGGWAVVPVVTACAAHVAVPFVGRDREMALMRVLLDEARQRQRPHLVTLLGESGIGKSRMVFELGRAVEDRAGSFRYVVGQAMPAGLGGPFGALVDVVRRYAGVLPSASPSSVREQMTGVVHRLLGTGPLSTWLLSQLCPPRISAVADLQSAADIKMAFDAWRRLLQEIAAEALRAGTPLALAFEDIHCADDVLLDFVEDIVGEFWTTPVVVIVTARPELQQRRPYWGAGKPNASTITLEPLSRAAADGLWSTLLDRYGGDQPLDSRESVPNVGGNPLFAVEYMRMLNDGASLDLASPGRGGSPVDAGGDIVSLPQSVYSIIAARIDTLSRAEKSVLQDAAVFGEMVRATSVAALGAWTPAEAQQSLEELERGGFMRRAQRDRSDDEPEYAFREVLVRDVAYAQIPRAVRADKHQRAATWLNARPAGHAALLAHHRQWAGSLAGGNGWMPSLSTDVSRLRSMQAGAPAGAVQTALEAVRGPPVAGREFRA